MNVISSSVKISTAQNGMIDLITSSILDPLTLQPTKSAVPTGGVAIQTDRLEVVISEVVGCIPSCVAF